MKTNADWIDCMVHHGDAEVSIELLGFEVLSVEPDPEFPWKENTRYEVVENKLIRITTRRGEETREELISRWQDWIDYWAVCFDYGAQVESRPGFIEGPVFVSHWQDFRTKDKRALQWTTPFHPVKPNGLTPIAVQVIDVFANEKMLTFNYDTRNTEAEEREASNGTT